MLASEGAKLPVVVNPETDSNTASVKDRFRPGNDIYGIAPKTVTNIQTSVTIRKPSLFDSFLFDLREINQSDKHYLHHICSQPIKD